MRRRRSAPPCDVLFVCTGNICRSPMAASMLVHSLPHLTVASAGTGALKGEEPHPNTRHVLTERGVPVLEHRGRQLTAAVARSAGLIVTMTREHRAWVVDQTECDAFTLHELSRLLSDGDSGDARTIAGLVTTRLMAERLDVDDRDVADPIGLPLEAYERCFDDLSESLRPLVAALETHHRRPEGL